MPGAARRRDGSRWVPAVLLLTGAAGWGWSLRMAADMAAMAVAMPGMAMAEMLSLAGFLFGWVAMMAAMMAVLVALGTMSLVWMALLSLLILAEKNAPGGGGSRRQAP